MTESETKTCQSCHAQFVIEPEDFAFYAKIQVPPPTWCPMCRAQRRMVWRNEWQMFRKDEASAGRSVFSLFSPASSVKIYEPERWESDAWDALEYGRDYDFSRPFFVQIAELMRTVPLESRSITLNENSDYSLNANHLRNCYLVRNATGTEDSAYMIMDTASRSSFDCTITANCELCYDSINLENCYGAIGSVNCENSREVIFCKDLVGCNNCIGSVGLSNKQYYIFNQPHSKEEYEAKLVAFNLSSYKAFQNLRTKSHELWLRFPNKFMRGSSNEQVSGDYIHNCKNAQSCHLVRQVEDSKYCEQIVGGPVRDCYDLTTFGQSTELVYESTVVGLDSYSIHFGWFCLGNTRNLEYSMFCQASSDLFGCVGLRKKQYCIFNKQYTKEEYEEMVPKIKAQMDEVPYTDTLGRVYRYGEFFPAELSPHEYNTTSAQEYFPLTKTEAVVQGYSWHDQSEQVAETSVRSDELPDVLEESHADLVGKIIECAHKQTCAEQCTGAFTFIGQELAFLIDHGLPLPRLCPNCRHYQRLDHRTGLRLYPRRCQCAGTHSENQMYENKNSLHQTHSFDQSCPNEFVTSFAPDRPDIVYCEDCYLKEVV